MSAAVRRLAGTAAALMLLLPGIDRCACAQSDPARVGLQRRSATRLAQAPARRLRTAPDPEANRLVARFLREGLRQPYVAWQTTRLLEGQVRESRQRVTRGGPGRERIEYLDPPPLRGEVLLTAYGRVFHYQATPAPRILEGVSTMEEMEARIRGLAAGLRTGTVHARITGRQEVAGRMATILEIRSTATAAFKRVWIDDATAVRLMTETVGPAGAVLSTSYFTRIEMRDRIEPAVFAARTLPRAPHAPLLPRTAPLATFEAAQAMAPFAARKPAPPATFRLTGAWAVGDGRRATVILRYSDGVNTWALFQTDVGAPAPPMAWQPTILDRACRWREGTLAFLLLGDITPAIVTSVIESVSPRR